MALIVIDHCSVLRLHIIRLLSLRLYIHCIMVKIIIFSHHISVILAALEPFDSSIGVCLVPFPVCHSEITFASSKILLIVCCTDNLSFQWNVLFKSERMLFLEAIQSLSTFFCGPLNESIKFEADLRTELCTYNCRTAGTVWRHVWFCAFSFVKVSFFHNNSRLLVHQNESLQKCPCVGDTGWRRWHLLYQFLLFELAYMHYRCVQICRNASLRAYSETASAIFVYSRVFSGRIICCLLVGPHLLSDLATKLLLGQLHMGFWRGYCF